MSKNTLLIRIVVLLICCVMCTSLANANQTNDSDKYTFDNYGGEVYTPEPMEFGANLINGTTPVNSSIYNETERKHVLLQFYSTPNDEQLELLKEYGVQRVGVAAKYTLIVSMSANITPADLPAESGLRWMGEIPVENKYNSLNVPDWARAEDGQVELEIRFYEDVTSQEALNIADKYSSSNPELLYHATNNDPIVYGIITEENNITSIASEDIVEFVYFSEPPTSPEDDGMVDNHQSPGFQFIFSILILAIAFLYLKREDSSNK